LGKFKKNEGGIVFRIIFDRAGLFYCRILVPAGYALSPQLPDIELPDMPFPGK
jgi:hypothetical protein